MDGIGLEGFPSVKAPGPGPVGEITGKVLLLCISKMIRFSSLCIIVVEACGPPFHFSIGVGGTLRTQLERVLPAVFARGMGGAGSLCAHGAELVVGGIGVVNLLGTMPACLLPSDLEGGRTQRVCVFGFLPGLMWCRSGGGLSGSIPKVLPKGG